jgi:enoyl-CoA hydratase
MTSSHLRLERHDGDIAQLTIDRPPVNALNPALLADLEDRLEGLASDPGLRALIVTGAGKVLSGGMDLKELQGFSPDEERAMVVGLNRAFAKLYGFPRPVITAINGHAIAGGFFFVLCGDYRVASRTARVALAEVRAGVHFPVGAFEMACQELAPPALRRLMLSGRQFDAPEAEAMGILDELLEPEQVLERAFAVARDYASIPPTAFSKVKAQLRQPLVERVLRATEDGSDETLAGWFTEETRAAAQAILSSR